MGAVDSALTGLAVLVGTRSRNAAARAMIFRPAPVKERLRSSIGATARNAQSRASIGDSSRVLRKPPR